MINIPPNIQELVSYKPGKPVHEIIQELGLRETAILWNNENNLGPSPIALQRVQEALAASNLYPDPVSLRLRQMIAERNDCLVDNVVIGNGSEAILDNMFRAFFSQGEELLTSEGTFVAVYIWARANRVPVKKVPLTDDYRFDVQALADAVTPKTKVVYLANPNNPTGTMASEEELKYLLDKIPGSVVVVVDEAYYEYARPLSPAYPDSVKLGYPNVLTLRTFSKAYGIAGIRVGYGIGPENLIGPLQKVKMTFAPSNLAQAAGIGALEDEGHLAKTVALNTTALKEFYQAFASQGLDYINSYGNFVMLDLGTPEKATTFSQELLQKGVFIRQLPAFGLPHCVRISTGTTEENGLLARAIREMG